MDKLGKLADGLKDKGGDAFKGIVKRVKDLDLKTKGVGNDKLFYSPKPTAKIKANMALEDFYKDNKKAAKATRKITEEGFGKDAAKFQESEKVIKGALDDLLAKKDLSTHGQTVANELQDEFQDYAYKKAYSKMDAALNKGQVDIKGPQEFVDESLINDFLSDRNKSIKKNTIGNNFLEMYGVPLNRFDEAKAAGDADAANKNLGIFAGRVAGTVAVPVGGVIGAKYVGRKIDEKKGNRHYGY